MESLKPGIRARRILWGAVIFLALIGVFVVARRTVHLASILIHGYSPPAVPSNPRLAQFATLDDVFARYPVLTPALHRVGAVAVQPHIPQTPSPMAPAERPHFILIRRGGRRLGAGDELRDAVYRRRQSSGGDDVVWLVVFVRARQSASTYSVARNCIAPRMDDSRLLDRPGGRHYPADHRRFLRHKPLFRPDAV